MVFETGKAFQHLVLVQGIHDPPIGVPVVQDRPGRRGLDLVQAVGGQIALGNGRGAQLCLGRGKSLREFRGVDLGKGD